MPMSNDPPGENGLPRDAPKAVGIGKALWQTIGNNGTQSQVRRGGKRRATLDRLHGKPWETAGRKIRG